jgi:uncharacterized protein (DUF1778 family)
VSESDFTLTTVTLTERERRACGRALQMAATFMDALDNPGEALEALELAERIAPEVFA